MTKYTPEKMAEIDRQIAERFPDPCVSEAEQAVIDLNEEEYRAKEKLLEESEPVKEDDNTRESHLGSVSNFAKAEEEESPLKDLPDPNVMPDIAIIQSLVKEMQAQGKGESIEAGGTFKNVGFFLGFKQTSARINTDGWIELFSPEMPSVSIPIRIQDLMTLATAAGALVKEGHVAKEYKGA